MTTVAADRIPQLPRLLHPAIKEILDPYPRDRQEVMAIMALPFMGTLAGGARFKYRNQEEHHLGFECCLIGEQSIGKSALTRMQKHLISELMNEDKETRMKMDEYADECNAKGDSKDKPKDPHLATRIMMPCTTMSQFYQNIKDLKGKRAIIVAPEIDSLLKTGNWSYDRGANERLMFDTEYGGQDTKTAKGTSAWVPLAVNFATSGTPVAVYRHYKNAEDGLVTRIAFCSFPPDVDEEAEERPRSKENLEQLLKIQKTLMAVDEAEVIDIPKLKNQMLDWCREKKIVADASGNQSIDTFRKRAAVMGFRAGCILYLLDGKKVGKRMLDFALWVAEYILYFQLKYFGQKMNESIEVNAEIMQRQVQTKCKNMWALVQLKDTFTYDDVKGVYEALGKAASGYRTIVSRWIKRQWVVNNSDGSFSKTELGLQMAA